MEMMCGTRPKPSHSKGKGALDLKKARALYEADIFKGIDPKELSTLFDDVELKACPKGTILFMPEDPSEKVYILRQGRVDVYQLNPSGKRLVTRRISSGSVFGMMGLLGQTIQGNFAETTEDSTVCSLTREDVLALLKQRPDIALRILEVIGSRLRLLEERLVETVYSPVRVRLAHFLLTNADKVSGVLTNVTQEEIGDMIGAVRQTVTETLGRMRNQGLILTRQKQIQIIDRQGLEKIVQGLES
jgi:CRP/FNR family cyclic AMP-dependent transcriptional regulator